MRLHIVDGEFLEARGQDMQEDEPPAAVTLSSESAEG